MPKITLPQVLDEILILHAGIATRLLNDFPDAYGVSLTISRGRSYATATLDVPERYTDGYREPGLETLAADLMNEIEPRMSELHKTISTLLGAQEPIFLNAIRNSEKNGLQSMGGIEMWGSIVGGIGSQSVRRQVVMSEDRIIAISATRLTLTGIIEDEDVAEKIRSAASEGITAAWDAMQNEKLFLNRHVAKKSEISRLRKWLSHFPNADVKFRLKGQVCDVAAFSKDRVSFLAIKNDDVLADSAKEKTAENSRLEVLVYDPICGLGENAVATPKPR